MKEAIIKAAAISFPKPKAKMCMWTEASDIGWAVIITQIPVWELRLGNEIPSVGNLEATANRVEMIGFG